MDPRGVTIVGAGLAGSEAAWQLAERGIPVTLCEMKPDRFSDAHKSEGFAELVCSNSFRGEVLSNAVGVLKEELRRLGSLIFGVAEDTRVPAGGALAVDRELFSQEITRRLQAHPLIAIRRGEIENLPEQRPLIVATGPLTSDALATSIKALTGGESLYFYDAISPIIEADSIDLETAYFASRYGKGAGDDYLNCPLDRATYEAFVDALLAAEKVPPRPFEVARYFPGCLPIEVIAESGRAALAFGPMKPVGLCDPRTGARAHAVVQLRRENRDGTAYNMVGFQTKLKWPEQKRVFQIIPGLAGARFLRLGSVHRNTYLDGPKLLDPLLQFKGSPGLYFAGQITGVEGYVESTAMGYLAALSVFAGLNGDRPEVAPATTAIGALQRHVSQGGLSGSYQPNNVHFGLFPDVSQDPRFCQRFGAGKRPKRHDRRNFMAERALGDLGQWITSLQHLGWRCPTGRPVSARSAIGDDLRDPPDGQTPRSR